MRRGVVELESSEGLENGAMEEQSGGVLDEEKRVMGNGETGAGK